MQAVTQHQYPDEPADDGFYVFTASTSEGLETLELYINDKLVNVIVDSGASCNLMSEDMFQSLTGEKTTLNECSRSVYTHARTLTTLRANRKLQL